MSEQPLGRGQKNSERDRPLIVLYLYVHAPGERFVYPNARASGSARRLAVRYLECAVTQAASLRLQDAVCDLALATNGVERLDLGREGRRLLAALRSLDVELIEAAYDHPPPGDDPAYVSSRYVFDAILAACAGQPPDRPVWLPDLDCVWARPAAMLAALPQPPALGCLVIDYPPEWNTVGSHQWGSRSEIARLLAEQRGAAASEAGPPPPWIGGELLASTAENLLAFVAEAERADRELAAQGVELATEEQLFTLLGAQGRAHFEDLSALGRRLQTGLHHEAMPVPGASELAFWHLPAEKGLSMRRTAAAIVRGRPGRVRADLARPGGAAARFRVSPPSALRTVRDGAWIVAQRARGVLPASPG